MPDNCGRGGQYGRHSIRGAVAAMDAFDSEGETYLRLELGHVVGIPTLVESSGQVPLVVDATVQEELQRVKI